MREIKISALSVGDWVRYDRGTDAVQIMGIYVRNNQECVVMSDSYYPDGVIGFVENIKPIPLTPEILDKNGFVCAQKNYDNGKMWDWWCDNILVRKFADEDFYRFIVEFKSKHYTTMMVFGKHTHQLQHALRLAGVEKKIEV